MAKSFGGEAMSEMKLGQNSGGPIDWPEINRGTIEAQNHHAIYGIGGLRDKFAADALRGLLTTESNVKDAAAFATDAYRFADAMLEARKDKP